MLLLVIENAKLIFTEGSGILVHDGTFEATNSTFEPHYSPKDRKRRPEKITQFIAPSTFAKVYNAGWVNVSLVGNIKGFIRNCSFEAGKGREDTIFAELGFFEEKKENTYGGCLFIFNSNPSVFEVSNCSFKNSEADFGGGAYVDGRVRVINCNFFNCKANWDGCGLSVGRGVEVIKCKCKVPCFITTATLKALGGNETVDDCYELNLFRQYRDNYLLSTPEGYQLVEEYYRISPFIVEKINAQPNREEIYNLLWERYLKPCLREIEKGNFERVKEIYIQMVEYLKKLYL